MCIILYYFNINDQGVKAFTHTVLSVFVFVQDFKPHIFIVAEEAYRNVQGQVEPVDQSLVVSGESGAGKVGRVKFRLTLASFR